MLRTVRKWQVHVPRPCCSCNIPSQYILIPRITCCYPEAYNPSKAYSASCLFRIAIARHSPPQRLSDSNMLGVEQRASAEEGDREACVADFGCENNSSSILSLDCPASFSRSNPLATLGNETKYQGQLRVQKHYPSWQLGSK